MPFLRNSPEARSASKVPNRTILAVKLGIRVTAKFNIQRPKVSCSGWARKDSSPANFLAQDYQLHTPARKRSYNGNVVPANPEKPRSEHLHHHHVYAEETTGLLIIAVVLLILVLLRYWSSIHQLFR